MAEKTKDELVEAAREAGIDPDGLTKAELEERLGELVVPELGPPADGTEFEAHGSVTGVQPMTADEIPDAGR